MTPEEKLRYLCVLSNLDNALGTLEEDRQWLDSKVPDSLCKYRPFDAFAESMILDSVVYFASPVKLDDPSELVICNDVEECVDVQNRQFTARGKELVEQEIRGVEELLKDDPRLNGEYCRRVISHSQPVPVSGTFTDIPTSLRSCLGDQIMQDLQCTNRDYLKNIRETMGICSLTQDPWNRELWNQYAEEGKGYCVEYETPRDEEHLRSLLPVAYGGDAKESLMRTLIRRWIMHNLEHLDHHCGLILGGKLRDMSYQYGANWYKLFCQKDEKWSYQQEWRFLGTPGLRHHLSTKCIYLGWNVSEENRNLVLNASEAHGFPVYQMKRPEEGKPLEYFKLKV